MCREKEGTDERMMVRLLAFALFADELLAFGKGLSSADEPDLWRKDLTGAIELWLEAGLPDEKRLRQACSRARRVVVVCYGQAADVWWTQQRGKLERLTNLTVIRLPVEGTQSLARLAERTMQLQCTVQDGQMLWTGGDQTVTIEPLRWKPGLA